MSHKLSLHCSSKHGPEGFCTKCSDAQFRIKKITGIGSGIKLKLESENIIRLLGSPGGTIVDRNAEEIIHLVASVCQSNKRMMPVSLRTMNYSGSA